MHPIKEINPELYKAVHQKIKVHPLTAIVLTYLNAEDEPYQELLDLSFTHHVKLYHLIRNDIKQRFLFKPATVKLIGLITTLIFFSLIRDQAKEFSGTPPLRFFLLQPQFFMLFALPPMPLFYFKSQEQKAALEWSSLLKKEVVFMTQDLRYINCIETVDRRIVTHKHHKELLAYDFKYDHFLRFGRSLLPENSEKRVQFYFLMQAILKTLDHFAFFSYERIQEIKLSWRSMQRSVA